jgi:AraC-like DNA-binding protein
VLYAARGSRILAKIAVELEEALAARRIAGEAGKATIRLLAQGDGWRVMDILCTSGPQDRPFEEQHSGVAIALVAAGTFQYRTRASRELMTPGSFLLGSPGQVFECAHEHGAGDRCVSFQYAPGYFESLVASRPRFRVQRLPPLRTSATLAARASAALLRPDAAALEELAVEVAAKALQLANDTTGDETPAPLDAVARVTRAVRMMERHPDDAALPLHHLAAEARLSPFHFLRTFTRVAGVTPHQFALRMKLREAALRLATGDARVLDIALDSGFGDLSNFNRLFRLEFGMTPRAYRRSAR